MNPIEIAYFKHFMLDKCEHGKFIRLYKTAHLDSNPDSIEKFFLKTSVKDVLLRAFYFKQNSILNKRSTTYDYWKELDDAWQKYWPIMENNHYNERWWDLRQTFAILRQNWDKPKFLQKEDMESIEETFKRLCLEPPMIKDEPKPEPEPEPEKEVAEVRQAQEAISLIEFDAADDPLADFDFFDEERPRTKLRSYEMSINFNKSFKLTLNIDESRNIKDKGLKFARLAKSKANDICLICNNKHGANISNHGNSNKASQNITINSKDICSKLRTLFNIKSDYTILSIEKIQDSSEYIIYKITKP